ncbi:MAG: RNA-directed DNA polymerase [Alphaproteobacteria bacterium]|nr:MAG: RNA-directed DNA polymerase [Alphaproteobacteria bacterium]
MLKTARFRVREEQLNKALHPQKMIALWKGHVRSVLRDQPVADLHDYYDFHINLENRIEAIRTSIFQGIYQPSRPIRVRSEKKHGLSRQLVILNPDDALVFETLGDFLVPIVETSQPSKKAYFSRNRPQPKSPDDVDENFGYPWWILWPQFQKRILEFSQKRKYTIVTDVANYYDGIDFAQLRNYISSLGHFSEILLDFLFFLLERFVWRPDYLPFPGRGLPQINLDAPRLVAHSFLFEIDRLLEESTGGDFVRWMDDIDFGCDDEISAKRFLGKIDDLLLSRGLHLNPSKTQILNSRQAVEYFQLQDNQFLTIFQKRLKKLINENKNLAHPKIEVMRKLLRKRFRKFIDPDRNRIGHWDKVFKRFFTIAATLKDSFLDDIFEDFLYSSASLRPAIFRYLAELGWSQSREDKVTRYLSNTLDDDSFFGAIDVLLYWNPDSLVQYTLRMRQLVITFSKSEDNIGHFLAGLWLIVKYGSQNDIDYFISKTINIWKSNDWLARQVVAIWPRINSEETKDNIKNVINSFGLTSAKLVLDNFNIISSDEAILSNKVHPYIMATMGNGRYTLPKFLIALSILRGKLDDKVRERTKAQLLKIVSDSMLRYYLIKA